VSFYKLTPTGVTLHLRVTPNAGRDGLDGVLARDDGNFVLAVRVKAVPEDGKANAAVVALFAKSLRLPKSLIAVTAGHTARQKTLAIDGDGPAIVAALEALFGR
jgi:uncharacterized protein (TIGR00251 family)